jgi:protein-S-isoprenylcysteine O-methyltransferase Ste14
VRCTGDLSGSAPTTWIISSEAIMKSVMFILLAVAGYGFVHSFLASLWAKAQARRLFGPAAGRLYRLAYNAIAVVTFLPVLALTAALPGRILYRIQLPWLLISLAGQFIAILALALGILQTGAGAFLGLRPLIGPAEAGSPRLVLTGLYRFVRHPLYTAGLLFIWLTPLMNTNLLALYSGLTVYIVLGALHEEYRLKREFGQAYLDYCRRTPMLIPYRWNHSNKI